MKQRLAHLDLLRGVAALMVCLEHLRAFLFVPFRELHAPNVVERIFYFLTGLGHQAVMVFFVLSGFLVGGSVIAARRNGKWSWSGYLVRRLSRLWMVLIPALLLTLVWDSLGQYISAAGYHGEFRALYNSGPTAVAPADLRATTFLGNVFFLQTITVNCYGSNGPLWSLANEFWYYLLLPLAWTVVVGGPWRGRVLGALLVAVLVVFLPGAILLGALTWLFGAGVYAALTNPRVRRWAARPAWLAGSGVVILLVLAATRRWQLGPAGDLLLGAVVACLVAGLAVQPYRPGFYSRVSAGASEFSYTLYLVHFPLLAFAFFSGWHGRQLVPGVLGMFWFSLILLLVLGYAAGIWWCFERNTDRLRRRLESVIQWCCPAACPPGPGQ